MTTYQRIIAKFTELNPAHIETLMLERYRALDSLTEDDFREAAEYAELIGRDMLEAEYNAAMCL